MPCGVRSLVVPQAPYARLVRATERRTVEVAVAVDNGRRAGRNRAAHRGIGLADQSGALVKPGRRRGREHPGRSRSGRWWCLSRRACRHHKRRKNRANAERSGPQSHTSDRLSTGSIDRCCHIPCSRRKWTRPTPTGVRPQSHRSPYLSRGAEDESGTYRARMAYRRFYSEGVSAPRGTSGVARPRRCPRGRWRSLEPGSARGAARGAQCDR